MNIFFNASISEFQKLIRTAISDTRTHEVVVDYDGEVILDPQLKYPGLDLDKFKVHFRVDEQVKKEIASKPNVLAKLFQNVLKAWNKKG